MNTMFSQQYFKKAAYTAVATFSALSIVACDKDTTVVQNEIIQSAVATDTKFTASFVDDFDKDGLKAYPFGPDMDDDADGFISRFAGGNDVDDQDASIGRTGKGNGLFGNAVKYGGTEEDGEFTGFADFNSDGWLDPFLMESSAHGVGVSINEGNGVINTTIHYSVNSDFDDKTPAVADFNEDGNLDVALVGPNVKIAWGNGDGYFTGNTDITVFGSAVEITTVIAADFDGDGHLDLAASDRTNNHIIVAFNDGTGVFSAPVTLTVAANSLAGMALGDLNGDGKLDLVIAREDAGTAPGTSSFLNNGNRSFGTEVTANIALETGERFDIALGDFNEDGMLDIAGVKTGTSADTVIILIGNGDGTFATETAVEIDSISFNPEFIYNVSDINGDGHLDIVSTGDSDEAIAILKGRGDGTFIAGSISAGYDVEVTGAAVADFNGDGIFDIAVYSQDQDSEKGLHVFYGR